MNIESLNGIAVTTAFNASKSLGRVQFKGEKILAPNENQFEGPLSLLPILILPLLTGSFALCMCLYHKFEMYCLKIQSEAEGAADTGYYELDSPKSIMGQRLVP